MGALFGHATFLNHGYDVGILYCRQSMRDYYARSTCTRFVQRLLHNLSMCTAHAAAGAPSRFRCRARSLPRRVTVLLADG
jgi:hypothetical protein